MPKPLVWAAGLLLAVAAGVGFWLGLSGSRPSAADDSGIVPATSIGSAKNAVAEASPALDEATIRRIAREEIQASRGSGSAPASSKKPADATASNTVAPPPHLATPAPIALPPVALTPAPAPPPPAQSAQQPILY